MTQDDDTQDRRLGLSTAQVVGSALAAMSGAVVASLAGTTGTVIGAAVCSVIATVGATMYTESLRRTGSAAKKTAAVVRQRGALITGALPRTAVDDQRPPDAHRAAAAAERETDTAESGGEHRGEGRWDLPWGKVAIASLAVMVTGLAGITAVEAMTGEPVSSLVGADDGPGTTVGRVVGDDSSAKDDPEPDKDAPATQEPEPSSETTEEPPAPEPSTTPDPTTEPSETPGDLSEGEAPAP